MPEVRILSPRPGAPGKAELRIMALARIYRPTKTAMQSGRANTRKWQLDYEPATPRVPDPLMGWSSAQDTLNQIKLRFATLDQAVAHAQPQGPPSLVLEPTSTFPQPQSYVD